MLVDAVLVLELLEVDAELLEEDEDDEEEPSFFVEL